VPAKVGVVRLPLGQTDLLYIVIIRVPGLVNYLSYLSYVAG
jgi:hypothetical protein